MRGADNFSCGALKYIFKNFRETVQQSTNELKTGLAVEARPSIGIENKAAPNVKMINFYNHTIKQHRNK